MKIVEFCRRILRRPMWPHQAEAATSTAFITVIAKARRTGGTVLAEDLAIFTAFSNRGCTVLILSATQDAARRITESIGATLNQWPETRGAVVDDLATRVRLRNGSQIVSLPSSSRQVRGYGAGVLLVILDEASFMPSELWTAAHYTALDERARGSRIVMIGTPYGALEHFFRQAFLAGQDGDPDYSSHHWRAAVNPQLDLEYLERMRHRVSPAEFGAEVLGEWSDAAGQLFSDDILQSQTVPLEVPTLAEMTEIPARPVAGMDYGVSYDRSAAAIVYRLPGLGRINPDREGRPTFLLLPHVWPVGARHSAVIEDVFRIPARYWSTETSGVGSGPSQLLEEKVLEPLKRSSFRGRIPKTTWNFVHTSNAKKTAGYGCLLGLAERGVLFWPNHPEFLRQMRGLRFEQGERGFTSIGAENPATHDDACDSAMLATLPWAPRGGSRVVCGLSDLAIPARAVADAELPSEPAEDFVESGSGVRFWRRPPLQSVAGPELWTPPSTAPAPPSRRGPEPLRLADRDQVLEAIDADRTRKRGTT